MSYLQKDYLFSFFYIDEDLSSYFVPLFIKYFYQDFFMKLRAFRFLKIYESTDHFIIFMFV